MKWMKIKDFCTTYGIPVSAVQRAIHSEWSNQIARKANPAAKYNSPWLIDVKKFLKLWEGGYF